MRIHSVNVGQAREVLVKHRAVQTGIYKLPVAGPVEVLRLGLAGDARIEPRKMGAEHHAVYAYPIEHYAHWQQVLGREPFPMGQFGENLTVSGLTEEQVRIGDILRFGTAVLQVAQPRIPCGKLNERMGLRFSPMFLASRRVGFYLRVLREGVVAAGDKIEWMERDDRSPTVEAFVRIAQYEYWDAQGLQHLLQARDLMPAWREMVEDKLKRTTAACGWHGLREFEIESRVQECDDIVSLRLRCVRGRPLASFHGGQMLTVVLGGHSAQQHRRPYAISSDPADLSAYRITVQRRGASDPDLPEGVVSSYLVGARVGDRVLCTAPHGPARSEHEPDSRIPVLISEGAGLAPMLSRLYELQARRISPAWLFHDAQGAQPQRLLHEVRSLIADNAGFHLEMAAEAQGAVLGIATIGARVPLSQADFYIAGSRRFTSRLTAELQANGIQSSVIHVQDFG